MTDFAELVAATNYSFLCGASHPGDMVGQAIDLGMTGIGIADRNTVAGVVRAHVALRDWRERSNATWAKEHQARSGSAVGRVSRTARMPVADPDWRPAGVLRRHAGCRGLSGDPVRLGAADPDADGGQSPRGEGGMPAQDRRPDRASSGPDADRARRSSFDPEEAEALPEKRRIAEQQDRGELQLGEEEAEATNVIPFPARPAEPLGVVQAPTAPQAIAHVVEWTPEQVRRGDLKVVLGPLKRLAGDRLWLGGSMPRGGRDKRRLQGLAELAAAVRVPMIATNDALYAAIIPRRWPKPASCWRESISRSINSATNIRTSPCPKTEPAARPRRVDCDYRRYFRRAVVSGTGDETGDHRRRFHAGRGQSTTPGDGDVSQCRDDPRVRIQDGEGRCVQFNYTHQPAATPYHASHAIFIAEGAEVPAVYHDTVPPVLAKRLISLRAFDGSHFLAGSEVVAGDDLEARILDFLARPEVAYLHAHYAGPGCFAAKIERS